MKDKIPEIKKSIIKTLTYREIFSYPLTFHQTYCYLISENSVDYNDFKSALEELLGEKRLVFENGVLHLGGLLPDGRVVKEEAAKKLLNKAKRVGKFFRLIPFVKLVAVTGAVAAGNAKELDDIDVLIVSKKNTLWITRFLVVTCLYALRLYRRDNDEGGKICPNIFIDETDLTWNLGQNVYTAHEVLMMKPILDRGETYVKFLNSNSWVKNFIPNLQFEQSPGLLAGPGPTGRPGPLEVASMRFQQWYMRKRKTNEITTDKLIHFRRDDHSHFILSEFKRRCEKLGM